MRSQHQDSFKDLQIDPKWSHVTELKPKIEPNWILQGEYTAHLITNRSKTGAYERI